MKILVTGATGYVGSRIAAALRRSGHDVVGMTRDSHSLAATELARAEVRPVTADLGRPESYRPLLADADVVVHAAGSTPEWDALLVDELETDERGAHLVHTQATSDTTVARRAYARGVAHTVVRPALVYGGDGRGSQTGRWFAAAQTEPATLAGDPARRCSWVHVDDLAAAYVTIVARAGLPAVSADRRVDGEVFCLADDTAPTVAEVFVGCIEAAGHRGPVAFDEAAPARTDTASVLTAAQARRCLGWSPRRTGVLDDLPTYFDAWQAFRGWVERAPATTLSPSAVAVGAGRV